MTPEIKVTPDPDRLLTFHVIVIEGGSRTEHEVTVSSDGLDGFPSSSDPEVLVRRSFEFLLEREPKESILRRFELSVIGRYFPEYEQEIKARMSL